MRALGIGGYSEKEVLWPTPSLSSFHPRGQALEGIELFKTGMEEFERQGNSHLTSLGELREIVPTLPHPRMVSHSGIGMVGSRPALDRASLG